MAYNFTAASSQYLSTASTPATAAPLTVACWAQTNTTTGNKALISIESGNSNDIFLLYFFAGTNALGLFVQRAGGTFGQAERVGPSLNTWIHCAGVASSETSRVVYSSGVAGATNTTNTGAPAVGKISIGSYFLGGSRLGYHAGLIAEVGIWNAALTQPEIASLAKGMTCDKVRPQSLVFYAPLVRDLVDAQGGLTITNNNGATVANHPRVYA
jgi:Concanavalin A-like lectin/glucanases superfamily